MTQDSLGKIRQIEEELNRQKEEAIKKSEKKIANFKQEKEQKLENLESSLVDEFRKIAEEIEKKTKEKLSLEKINLEKTLKELEGISSDKLNKSRKLILNKLLK